MSTDILQRTLSGGEQHLQDIEELRERPGTLRWCHECEEYVLRSRFGPHEDHDYVARQQLPEDGGDGGDGEDEEEAEPEQVGAWYDITISYTTEYRFRVPAWDEHRATELAKEWHWDAKPADEFHMHTDRREIKEITSADVPDDFDIYGETELWEVLMDDD